MEINIFCTSRSILTTSMECEGRNKQSHERGADDAPTTEYLCMMNKCCVLQAFKNNKYV